MGTLKGGLGNIVGFIGRGTEIAGNIILRSGSGSITVHSSSVPHSSGIVSISTTSAERSGGYIAQTGVSQIDSSIVKILSSSGMNSGRVFMKTALAFRESGHVHMKS